MGPLGISRGCVINSFFGIKHIMIRVIIIYWQSFQIYDIIDKVTYMAGRLEWKKADIIFKKLYRSFRELG